MRTRYRNGKPPYNQGNSEPPLEDMPLTEVMVSDATMVSMPDNNMLLRQQLASDQENLGLFNSTFGEFYNTDEESSNLPYPSSWTGSIDVDSNPYILELAGLPALMKGASKHLLKKGVKEAGPKVVKRGGNESIDALRRQNILDFSKRMGNKRVLDEQQQRIAQDRLDYITDRLLNEAKTEDMVDDLNLQAHLTDLLEAAANEEKDRVDQILMDIVSDETTKRDLRDQINSLAELLSGRSGGETGSLLSESGKDFMGMGSQSMTEYLANPSKFDKVAGYPRLPYDITKPVSRNEFGGKITVIK